MKKNQLYKGKKRFIAIPSDIHVPNGPIKYEIDIHNYLLGELDKLKHGVAFFKSVPGKPLRRINPDKLKIIRGKLKLR